MLRQSHWRWGFQGQPKLHSWNPSHKVELLLDLVTISHRPNLTGCLYSCQGEFTTCRNYINTMPLPWWPHFLSSLSGVYLLNPSLARTAPVQALGVMVPKEALALSSQIRWLLRPQLLVFLLARASRFWLSVNTPWRAKVCCLSLLPGYYSWNDYPHFHFTNATACPPHGSLLQPLFTTGMAHICASPPASFWTPSFHNSASLELIPHAFSLW